MESYVVNPPWEITNAVVEITEVGVYVYVCKEDIKIRVLSLHVDGGTIEVDDWWGWGD